ncbi:collagen alpha-1(XIV) chain isoform X5 [Syngnathoides biaculeatus]|uniref:collagen alpha-1(XIV) chain isoform X5 n=1 Tax=Syngnathoides biaculeatus TaxID=300417 RepID=UPI002ADE58B7|nr:collagen alpha-1(XIV) chain isoform X5 [Syngnathoides biaculeatus]
MVHTQDERGREEQRFPTAYFVSPAKRSILIIAAPRRLRFKVLKPNKLLVSWREPKGDFDSYLFLYKTLPGGHQREIITSKSDSKVLIADYEPSKDYVVRVIAVGGSTQSRALLGRFKAVERGEEDVGGRTEPQRLTDSFVLPEDVNEIYGADQFVCHTESVADIVILVDGSWSIGRLNFRLVRVFLENLVNAFDVGIDKTRIGLVQYSGDPRMEWNLNAFTNKEAVIDAVKNLPYKGGNTLTGLALSYILENCFKPQSGARAGVPKIGVLITDGKSQDDVTPPAESLHKAGVELFAIGVKNADENELRSIASEPDDSHVYNVADFSVMSSIVEGLTRTVCEQVEQQDKDIKEQQPPEVIRPPSGLVTSEVTARSFRVTWRHSPGNVEKYRVVFSPVHGGQPQEAVVDGRDTSVVLRHLDSQTKYRLSVFAANQNEASEPATGYETTLALPSVTALQLLDATHNSMRARWDSVKGASGYMLLFTPLTDDGGLVEKEVKVSEAVTELELDGLVPRTEYSVSVYAMYGEEASDPITNQETTLPLSAPGNLQFSDISHNSARIGWDPSAAGAAGYRITWVKTDGRLTEEVEVGPVRSYVLSGLTSLTEYSVAVFALYDEGQSEPLTDGFTTTPVPGPLHLRSSDVSPDSFRVSWDHSADDIVVYRVSWAPLAGGDAKQVVLSGSTDRYTLADLKPSTAYEVMVTAVFKDQSESDAVSVTEITLAKTTTTTTAATTSAPRRALRKLLVNDETTQSLRASWELDDPLVDSYRVSYASLGARRTDKTVFVPGGQKSALLDSLLPDTEYNVTVTPIYGYRDVGVSVSTRGTTLALLPPENLRVSEEWYNRFRVTWDPPPSAAAAFKIFYRPVDVPGRVSEMSAGEDVNSLLLLNLQSGTEYDVQVTASYPAGQSQPLLSKAKTLFLGVSGLTVSQLRHNSLCVEWQPHLHATHYRISIQSTLNSQRQEVSQGGGASRQCFYDLFPSSQYEISIRSLMQEMEGPAVTVTGMTLPAPTQAPTEPPPTEPPPTIPPAKEVCKEAKADLAFLVDGSWSIGDDNFMKITKFLYSTIGSLDQIGPDGTQVAICQFSDDARTEVELSSHGNKEALLEAIQRIKYKGGNTKTGRAIKHVKESIFNSDAGARRGVPKVLVVLTDGRSQDDVNKVSKEMQMEGYIIFAIGFADADYGELVNIASKPGDRHVFFVDDLDAVKKIEEHLITFVCEAATATCPSILMSGGSVAGFHMMDKFGLAEKEYSTISGVSLEPGSFNSFPCYRLHRDALVSQPTKFLHPEGLPSDYTISVMFRLLPETPHEPFALWEILDKDNKPLVGLILDYSGKSLTFFNYDYKGDFQTVTFEGTQIKKVFHGSFHKLHVTISKTAVTLVLDCALVGEKAIGAAGNITTDGVEILGRTLRSRGRRDSSAPFQLQMFDIICSTSWASRDKCCELPALRVEEECPSMPHACACAQDSKGPPGPSGPPGGPGIRGTRGDRGEPGVTGVCLSTPHPEISEQLNFRGRKGLWERPAPPDHPDRQVLRDPAASLFKALRGPPGRRDIKETSAHPAPRAFLGVRAPRGGMDPLERGACRVTADLKVNRGRRARLGPRVHLGLRAPSGQRDLKGNKDLRVLLVSKEIKEKEVTCSRRQPCARSQDKCVSSSFKATCLATTPS